MRDLITPSRLLEIMEGNRRLTLRTLAAFPEEALFTYAPAEPLRPFAAMIREMLNIEVAYVRGIATGEWRFEQQATEATTKQALLAACEAVREQSLAWWPQITAERLLTVEVDPFFGGEQPHLDRLLYGLENEIHHRGQGYIYLRMLGIEPPAFYER